MTLAALLAGLLAPATPAALAAGQPVPPAGNAAAAPTAPVTVPALSNWKAMDGEFKLTSRSRVLVDPSDTSLHDDAQTFAEDLATTVGRKIPVVRTTGAARPDDVRLRLDTARSDLRDEGYAMDVGASIGITARTDTGAFYGTRTVLQLLKRARTVPAGLTKDVPEYAERGAGVCACVINVSVPWFERLLKDAAYLKLNQLWVELKVKSEAQPEANEWGYYTRPQIAQLQKLADKYHITLVPEVNSPGHIETWIRNRPDLQLTDSDGKKQVSRLDITKPEAFTFLTSIIDEYFQVFRTPYWHMGADEYMLGSAYAKYPQMAAYAKERFGSNAVPQDAFVDFVNRINAYVKAKGKKLRVWNDGITSAATQTLDRDILVEHWYSYGFKPSELRKQGYTLMNASNDLYHVRGTYGVNSKKLYDNAWDPRHFLGETLETSEGITGAKVTMWPDNGSGSTENEVAADMTVPLRLLSQVTWAKPKPDPDFAAFTTRVNTVGHAPGAEPEEPAVDAGTYTLTHQGKALSPKSTTEGAPLATAADPTQAGASAWELAATKDGYHTLKDTATGRCAEAKEGTRYLNTPLEAGAPITAQTCEAGNRLQRWELTPESDGVSLTNAITRMSAVLGADGRLNQQIPDVRRATRFTLTATVRVSASADTATFVGGSPAKFTVQLANTTSQTVTALSATPTVPQGWTLTPATRTGKELAPGGTWTAEFTVTPPEDGSAGPARLTAAVAHTARGVRNTTSVAVDSRLSCAAQPTRPKAVTYVNSEETAAENGRASNTIDGDPNTYWTTEWSAQEPGQPHEIQFDLGATAPVCAVTYLPRQGTSAGAANGRFAQYEIYLSTDGKTWGNPVSTGTFPNSAAEQTVPFTTTTARYLRLVQRTEVNGKPWASAAEVTAEMAPAT